MTNVKDFLKNHFRDISLIALLILVIVSIGISIYSFYLVNQNKEEVTTETIAIATTDDNEEDVVETAKTVFVDVKGAVKTPGVYEVSSDAIINDVITLAGGFTSSAYQNGINLSKKVSDELVIYVYTKTEIKNSSTTTSSNDTCTTTSYDICECVEEKASVIETSDSSTSSSDTSNSTSNSSSETTLININTATSTELTTLSGIGDAKAEAIISYREENGLFSSIEDILNVSGIGETLFAQIKDYITV